MFEDKYHSHPVSWEWSRMVIHVPIVSLAGAVFFHGQCAAVPALAGAQGAGIEKKERKKETYA